jgi:hypothetical protein
LEISNISHRSYVISWEEMWVWVRGMCISKGDDTSPVANDHVSCREMSYLPREMWYLSTGDVEDLQNFGSVTLLVGNGNFLIETRKFSEIFFPSIRKKIRNATVCDLDA